MGPRTPPGVQTHQFPALGAAVATRRAPEGQESPNLEPPASRSSLPPFFARRSSRPQDGPETAKDHPGEAAKMPRD